MVMETEEQGTAGTGEGQAEEQQQGQGTENQKEGDAQSGTPPAENGAEQAPAAEEPKDPNLYDDTGVLWKNRAKEAERKRTELLEKVATMQHTAPQLEPDNDDVEIPSTKAGVKQVLSEYQRDESRAQTVLNSVIERLSEDNPEIAGLKGQIEEQLKTVDIKLRKDPGLIEAVSFAVYGRNTFKRKNEPPKPVTKKLISTAGVKSDVLSPSPKGGSSNEVSLTEDEKEYAEHNRFFEKGFDGEEIREMYKLSKKNKGG